MEDFANKVVYQIYPRSFQDTDGDGFGDLRGIVERLDYLEDLGVDYLWLNPFFVSPQKDNGYDIADYRQIDPRFGTMEDLDALIQAAQEHHIGLMFDMVFNHTSVEHEWFQKALAGDEKYKNYYIFKKPVDGHMPNNWVSKFGGPVWEYVPVLGEYYLHLYDVSQADLNWDNPDVRQECADIVKFWMDKGVKGFRFDVVNNMSKGSFEDDFIGDGRRFYSDGPHIHEYLHGLNRASFGQDPSIMTVGEMSSTSLENCQKYANPEQEELGMVFNFHHLKVDYENKQKWTLKPFDFMELKELFNTWQTGMQETNSNQALFWNCHDQPRSLSRFGDDKNYPVESAKMLAMALHMMRGTPYIYQGEEIGMTNNGFDSIEQYRDVESTNYYEILKAEGKDEDEILAILGAKSRDNARSPMQWTAGKNAGFSDTEPWIRVNPNHATINVEAAIADPDSIYSFYKKLIRLRKESDTIQHGTYVPLLEEHERVLAYKRVGKDEEIIVLCNFYGEETTVSLHTEADMLLSNYADFQMRDGEVTLRPYEAVVLRKAV